VLRELGLCSLEERRLGGDLITVYKDLREGCSAVGVSPISQATGGRRRGKSGAAGGLGGFRFRFRQKVFNKRVVKHWNRLPREVVESPSLEAFESRVDLVPRDTVQW